ncbi:MAG: sigma-70 family RNA polymerase sigma factor [Patescibacteria group bacterium]
MSNRTTIPPEHLRLIILVAHKLVKRLPSTVEVEDMIACGVIGYLESRDRYDPSKGTIESFLEFRIRGAMLDKLRDQDIVPRSFREAEKRVRRAEQAYFREHGCIPETEDIARALEMPVEAVRRVRAGVSVYSLYEPVGEGDTPAIELLPDPRYDGFEMEEFLDTLRAAANIERAMSCLTKRGRFVVRQYFFEDRMESEIAAMLCITESRVSQLLKKELATLKRVLADLAQADRLMRTAKAAKPREGESLDEFDALEAELKDLLEREQ